MYFAWSIGHIQPTTWCQSLTELFSFSSTTVRAKHSSLHAPRQQFTKSRHILFQDFFITQRKWWAARALSISMDSCEITRNAAIFPCFFFPLVGFWESGYLDVPNANPRLLPRSLFIPDRSVWRLLCKWFQTCFQSEGMARDRWPTLDYLISPRWTVQN